MHGRVLMERTMIVEKLLSLSPLLGLAFLLAYFLIAILAWHVAYNWKTRQPKIDVTDNYGFSSPQSATNWANALAPAWPVWLGGCLLKWLVIDPIKSVVFLVSIPLGRLVSSVYPPRKGSR